MISPISFRGALKDELPDIEPWVNRPYQERRQREYQTQLLDYNEYVMRHQNRDTYQKRNTSSTKVVSGKGARVQEPDNNKKNSSPRINPKALFLALLIATSIFGVKALTNPRETEDPIPTGIIETLPPVAGDKDGETIPIEPDSDEIPSNQPLEEDPIEEEPENILPACFDFECTMSEEQEYSVQKFMENWYQNKDRYEKVAAKTGKPAALVAAIHWRESGGNFKRYFHDGTPIGDPVRSPLHKGKIYYSFEESAIDALSDDYFKNVVVEEGDFDQYLYFAERYNGFGYRNAGLVSPYIMAGTSNYTSGKYVSDGTYDPNFVDEQPGVALLLLKLWEAGELC